MLLDEIESPKDIKFRSIEELEQLSEEIRGFLIEKVSNTGGHIASNLGVVELTLAVNSVYNPPQDKIIWDVGHQTYVNKILTGRKNRFDTLRQMGGISGFPKKSESEYDVFNTGHSSTSISAALGYARARDILKEDYRVIAVIGDGALTGGMAFEALNDAGSSRTDLTVIINDNEMSITKNVGGMSKYLSKIRTEPFYYKVKEDLEAIVEKIPAIGKSARKVLHRVKGSLKCLLLPGLLFEELGFKYFGPIDGHNIGEMMGVFTKVRSLRGPVILHVCTKKGKGYCHAEARPHEYHGIAPFDIDTGLVKKNGNGSFSQVSGEKIIKLSEKNPKIVAITAAMPHATHLDAFQKRFPDRFFDVGIAEQHAVTFAAGLSSAGMIPVLFIYSSFYQRAYDQILHDVALQKLHVVFAVDRAGIVGEDGETHQGIYDISFFNTIPYMTIVAPADYNELEQLLQYAVNDNSGPIAIRYPRGAGIRQLYPVQPLSRNRGIKVRAGEDITLIAAGNMVERTLRASELLAKSGIDCEVINPRFLKPLDDELILASAKKTKKVITVEDNIVKGGFGSSVLQLIQDNGLSIRTELIGFPDNPVEHGSKSELYLKYGLDIDSIVGKVKKMCQGGI